MTQSELEARLRLLDARAAWPASARPDPDEPALTGANLLAIAALGAVAWLVVLSIFYLLTSAP